MRVTPVFQQIMIDIFRQYLDLVKAGTKLFKIVWGINVVVSLIYLICPDVRFVSYCSTIRIIGPLKTFHP